MGHMEFHHGLPRSAGAFPGIRFPSNPIPDVWRAASLDVRRESVRVVSVSTSVQTPWTGPVTNSENESDGR